MFTGLVEELGLVKAIKKEGQGSVLVINCKTVVDGSKIGDSISTNGVCLTITDITAAGVSADIMPETMARSNLSLLKLGEKVNLERALRLSDRLGGHMVSGHVDGQATLTHIVKSSNAQILSFSMNIELLQYLIPKASIAINGVSLTVFEVTKSSFSVSLIPETLIKTNLQYLRSGQSVNIEIDMQAKYIKHFMSSNQGIDQSFLAENGFM